MSTKEYLSFPYSSATWSLTCICHIGWNWRQSIVLAHKTPSNAGWASTWGLPSPRSDQWYREGKGNIAVLSKPHLAMCPLPAPGQQHHALPSFSFCSCLLMPDLGGSFPLPWLPCWEKHLHPPPLLSWEPRTPFCSLCRHSEQKWRLMGRYRTHSEFPLPQAPIFEKSCIFVPWAS